MTRWMSRILLPLLALGALVLGVPTPAHAAPEDCLETYYATGGRELFEPQQQYLPPPLRGSGWDCASRVADAAGGPVEATYVLVWVDIPWDRFVGIIRAFEDSEWVLGDAGLITAFDYGGGGAQLLDTDTEDALTAEDLAELDPLDQAHARFSNDTTRRDIITIDYYDGDVYDGLVGFDEPHLIIEVLVNEPYVDGTAFDDPSTLSDLRTIGQAAPTAVQWAVIASGSVMLMLVVGWPSTLLNSVVGSRYQQLVRWVRARAARKKPEAAEDAAPDEPVKSELPGVRQSRLPGWLMWPGFALAAILGAFVDPDFGFNPMSARLVLSLFLSFLLFNLAAWWIVRAVAVRLQPDSDPYLRFRWGSLVLVIVAVLVARLLGLEPGVIFGLVAGVAYATTLQAAKSAVVTIVGSAFGLVLALVAWVGYSFLAPLPIDNAAYVFVVEFLAGVTVKGVSTLPLSLLPLGNLEGAKLFGWRKVVWGASYAVGLAAFLLVLATIPKAWGEVPEFLRWIWVFGAYAVVAVAVWAVNARLLKKKPLPPEKEQGDQPDAITID
jgi:Kef-type K+ transport systems, membrane components